ncbi:hypothetical protein BDV93DRAFT_129240 [Ceratobasidium sp. AG-I]|nr:hypothetical protein BDV93DRAFT_129240 [Ceratobasidium sp. AG-I]
MFALAPVEVVLTTVALLLATRALLVGPLSLCAMPNSTSNIGELGWLRALYERVANRKWADAKRRQMVRYRDFYVGQAKGEQYASRCAVLVP